MTLKFVTGYATDLKKAKDFALHFYNQAEGRKRFEAVESQTGENEIGNQVWITTIWYTELADPVEKEKEEEKYLFIGSDDIDPNDPNWREKWDAQQQGSNDVSVQVSPTVEIEVHKIAETIVAANAENDKNWESLLLDRH